jgi:hypothetical protein
VLKTFCSPEILAPPLSAVSHRVREMTIRNSLPAIMNRLFGKESNRNVLKLLLVDLFIILICLQIDNGCQDFLRISIALFQSSVGVPFSPRLMRSL